MQRLPNRCWPRARSWSEMSVRTKYATRALLAFAAAGLVAAGCDTAEPDASSLDTPAPAPVDTAHRRVSDSESAGSRAAGELRSALQQLLAGGQPASDPAHSWFSEETADALRSVAVDSAGHATVDFADLSVLIPNASSSAGSTLLLDQLNSTVFGIDGVESVDYLIEGSCDRFWEWLQYSCRTVERTER